MLEDLKHASTEFLGSGIKKRQHWNMKSFYVDMPTPLLLVVHTFIIYEDNIIVSP